MRELRPQKSQLCAVLPVDAITAKPRDTGMGGEVADRGVHGCRL